jgi:hypothetical protein
MHQSLPAGSYPNAIAVAPCLYGSLDEQFAYRLDSDVDRRGSTV